MPREFDVTAIAVCPAWSSEKDVESADRRVIWGERKISPVCDFLKLCVRADEWRVDGRLKTFIIRLCAYCKNRRQQDLYLSRLLNQSYADAAFDALQTALNLWMAVYGISHSKHEKPKLGRAFVFRKIKKIMKEARVTLSKYLAHIRITMLCIQFTFQAANDRVQIQYHIKMISANVFHLSLIDLSTTRKGNELESSIGADGMEESQVNKIKRS